MRACVKQFRYIDGCEAVQVSFSFCGSGEIRFPAEGVV
ncbi:hypothetical protein BAP_3300 [Bacillus sp. CN2]|nr:hypothetical protein BAP_3300 [Bacillus sp. CN2]